MIRTPAWALFFVCWCVAAYWVFAHPPVIGSDDALFFLRGLTRFSILDFSPQFPGYPGYILIGRAMVWITGEPLSALGLSCAAMALALPWVAAAAAARVAGQNAGLWAGVLVLLCPLGPDLSLSLLSDGAGVLFGLVFLACLPRDPGAANARVWALFAGLALGWALACRPTNLVWALSSVTAASLAAPRALWPVWIGGLLVLGPVGFGLLATEPLYLREASRFIEGHALVWGNTAITPQAGTTWTERLLALPPIAILLGLTALSAVLLTAKAETRRMPAIAALTFGLAGHAIWVVMFQNPDNPRHLAPLLIIGAIMIAVAAAQMRAVQRTSLLLAAAASSGWAVMHHTEPDTTRPPPLAQVIAMAHAAPTPPVLITNRGVETLRDALPQVVIQDAYYQGSTAFRRATSVRETWCLSAEKPELARDATRFEGRHLGEQTLYLSTTAANKTASAGHARDRLLDVRWRPQSAASILASAIRLADRPIPGRSRFRRDP